ncbi:MAG: ATP-dependent Clp protease ATP-binding subunit [Planctomycetes bacterium]|nr:ATP-dependent Clp protease ATP-binding subunit [Planctomycetota bacterium]
MKTLSIAEQLKSLSALEAEMPREIRGQAHVLPRMLSVLRRGQLGLKKPGRPRGTFLLLGPTGTGKTESTLVFTRRLFGDEALIRLDMSEYQTQGSLGVLIGSQPGECGYLGMERQRLTEGTLLLDEIEKAHPRVLDICLQLLDAARVTLANGKTLDFSPFYVALTSNLGSAEILGLQHSSAATLERHVLSRAQQALRPEMFARIDETLVFHPLNYEVQLEIAEKFLCAELAFLRDRGHALEAGEAVLPFLVRKGFHPKLGARPMRNAVEKLVGDAVAKNLLGGCDGSGTLAVVEEREELAVVLESTALHSSAI